MLGVLLFPTPLCLKCGKDNNNNTDATSLKYRFYLKSLVLSVSGLMAIIMEYLQHPCSVYSNTWSRQKWEILYLLGIKVQNMNGKDLIILSKMRQT